MKKTLLFAFAILLSMATMAQNRTFFLEETFSGNAMPAGWSISGVGLNNWSLSSTQYAGGDANEMKLDWSPQFNGLTRLVSPAVDLTGVNSVFFSFKHAVDNYQGSNTIGIATTSNGGSSWNEVWSQAYNSSWTQFVVTQEVTNADMGHNNVQFCVYFTGNSYNINSWYFDDISVFTLENLDVSLNKVIVPDFFSSNVPGQLDVDVNVGFTVTNYGVTPVTSIEATYAIDGQAPVTETFNLNLASLATQTLEFEATTNLNPGSYNMTVSIDKVNGTDDDVAENNTFSKEISVALSSAEMIPMIEHFSSSTCGPCVSVNNQMLTFCNNNEGRFTYTKYQMNWPGSGDPYYTAEGGVRRDFYGVNAVPQCFLDGEDQGYAAITQSAFDTHASRTAVFDVRGSFVVEGNTISVVADVIPFVTVSSRVYISVNEKTTHNNVGSNGETSFHHVFMKMLTSVDGTPVDFVNGESQHFTFTQDLSSTHVEEMSDLEVSIWVQNYSSHEVYNSHFAYEYTDHPYPVDNLTLIDNNGRMEATWEAPAEGNPQGYNVFVNGMSVLENTTQTEYAFDSEPNKFYVVEVVALYGDDKTSIKKVAMVEGAPVVCDPVTDLVAVPYEYEDELGALVSWTEPEGAISYDVYVDDEYLGEVDGQPVFIGFDGEAGGVYTIGIVAVYEDCESEMATVDFDWDPTSVDENAIVKDLYPNPAKDSFKLEGQDIARVAVYNLMGQKMVEVESGKWNSISVAGWEKGLYIVTVTSQNGRVETRKLMVE